MKSKFKSLMIIGCVCALTWQSWAEESSVPASFRKKALKQADEEIQNNAVSPVSVAVTSQPGYVRSTTQGNLAAYSNSESYSTFQLNETRAQLLIGDAYLLPHHTGSDQLDIALRYQISPRAWPETSEAPWHLGPLPLSLWAEVGTIPGTNRDIEDQGINTLPLMYSSSIYFNYHVHFALIDELPHGNQKWIVPEAGVGFSLVSTSLKYTAYLEQSFNSQPDFVHNTADTTQQTVHPYFSLGVHLFSDHFISLNLQGSYVPIPFPSSVLLPGGTGFNGNQIPGQVVVTNAPTSNWALEARLQMKLVWPTLTHTPLVPQLMPPWLMPSYTTDEISPWVAAPEVTQRWNQPGRPPVGNVMFQYTNRWAKRVEIIGEFNDWAPEPMIRDRSGIWLCVKDLPIGKFRYNYVVDGKTEILDPWNKNVDTNSRQKGSSLVVVK